MKTSRNFIQTLIKVILASAIFLSDHIPLVLTAYFALAFSFLSTFNEIAVKESQKEISYDSKRAEFNYNKGQALGTPAILATIVIQLLSLGAVFLLTWYVLEKKLNYFG